MLRRFLPVLLCSFVLFGCTKTTPDSIRTINATQPVNEDTVYTIGGITDITLDSATDEKTIALSLTSVQGRQPHISLLATGAPENVSIWFTPEDGTVPFTTVMHIKNNYGKGGTYDVIVKGTTADGRTKSVHFKLKVPASSCADRLSAKSKNYTFTSPFVTSPVPINKPDFALDTMYFRFLPVETMDAGTPTEYTTSIMDLVAIVNCDNGTITVPASDYTYNGPTAHTYHVSGSGTFNFTDKTINITYTTTEGSKSISFGIQGKTE